VADDRAFFSDQFQHHIVAGNQRVDQPGLGVLTESVFLDEADRARSRGVAMRMDIMLI
jgi:hypothetical protein